MPPVHSISAAASPSTRIDALDLTKGVLVVLMVAYHSLNYTTEFYLAFRYLSFLPASFIFLTGFIVANIYSARYDIRDQRLHRRLLLRGARLVALFTALNVGANLIKSQNYNGEAMSVARFFQHWYEVYVLGSGRLAAFEVLLPIGYLLLASPVLLRLNHRSSSALPILTVVVITATFALEHSGAMVSNLNLLSAGLLGMVAGRISIERLGRLGRYPLQLALAYGACHALGMLIGLSYAVQLLGACVALSMIYAFSVRFGSKDWLPGKLVRLGQYSLVSYILQIGLLQVLARFLGHAPPWSLPTLALFLATLMLMLWLVEAAHWLRARSTDVERLYRAVFA